jgi:hypothetical protein
MCVALLIISPAESAEDDKKLFFLSPALTGYFPTNSSAKNAFGSSWWGVGVSLNMETLTGGVDAVGLRLSPYFGLYHGEKHGNDAWIIPVGIQARLGGNL